jgi:hypothetical protein
MIYPNGKNRSNTCFLNPERLLGSKWDEHRAIIEEAYRELDGLRGVMWITGLSKSSAQRLTVRFGLVKGDQDYKKTTAQRESKNLRHLKIVWDWEPGQENLILRRAYHYTANRICRCGGVYCRPGESYTQYGLPTGGVLDYMKKNGLKFYIAGEEKIPVDKVTGKGLLSIKDKSV